MTWAVFTTSWGNEVRIVSSKVMAIHGGDPNFKSAILGAEYQGPVTFIEYGPTTTDEATGVTVRGTLDDVQRILDGVQP